MELDDLVFGNSWTKSWRAHARFNSDPEVPCECEGHTCLGMHSMEGHAPAGAVSARAVQVTLIIIESPTPTPFEIDAYTWHW